jgi:hypothetical protein
MRQGKSTDQGVRRKTRGAQREKISPQANRTILLARTCSTEMRGHRQPIGFARYTKATVSEVDQGRDRIPVWALPGQSWLSDYLRIPSLPITSR